MINHSTFELFFITGLPKSGTTWCVNFLNHIPNVRVLGEGRFFGGGLKGVNSMNHILEEAIRPWVDFISRRKSNWLNTDNYIVTLEKTNYISSYVIRERHQHVMNILMRSLVLELARDIVSGTDIKLVGEKTSVVRRGELTSWTNCFYDKKFIFLIRNFIDWVVSCALHYSDSVSNCRPDRESFWFFSDDDFINIYKFKNKRIGAILSSDKLKYVFDVYREILEEIRGLCERDDRDILLVKYEDIFGDPYKHFYSICRFLGIDIEEGFLEKCVDDTSLSKVLESEDSFIKEHIRVAIPGKGEEFFDYDVSHIIAQANELYDKINDRVQN